MKRELLSLLAIEPIQQRIISLLIILGVINKNSTNYKNATLSEKGLQLISSSLVSSEDVEKLRNIFPPGSRGSADIIRTHMTRFLNENPDYTVNHVLQAATLWVNHKGEFCGDAKYFFYKKVEGGEETRCLQVLETLRENSTENVV